jgi:hypothetical protein
LLRERNPIFKWQELDEQAQALTRPRSVQPGLPTCVLILDPSALLMELCF